MSLQLVEEVVEAVIIADALQRKPEEYKYTSFFGKFDLWVYLPVYDEKLCPKCEAHARQLTFKGKELRRTFPYLEIVDENLIMPNVHPNCRCELLRIIEFEQYMRLKER